MWPSGEPQSRYPYIRILYMCHQLHDDCPYVYDDDDVHMDLSMIKYKWTGRPNVALE